MNLVAEQKVYLTPKQASDQYGVPLSTIYRWCQEGKVELLDLEGAPVDSMLGKYHIEKDSLVEKALDWAGIDK
jgi:predicted site-specific integrase-resolvase